MRFPSLSRRADPVVDRADSAVDADTDHRAAVATDSRPAAERINDGHQRSTAAPTARPGTVPPSHPADQPRTDVEPPSADRPGRRTAIPASSRDVTGASPDRPSAPDGTDRNRVTDRPSAIDQDRRPDLGRGAELDGGPNRARDGSVERPVGREPTAAAGGAQVVTGRKPRASLLATLGLIVGLAGLLFVVTGTLAGYGIGIGAAGAVLAVLGLIATRRRHVAGKPDALLGMAFGLGAVVLGVLAMTGQYDWPTTDGDMVARLREWLDSRFVDRI